jgi:hypothetical protein
MLHTRLSPRVRVGLRAPSMGQAFASSLTVRSTWTPTWAMPSACSWPMSVPCALRASAPVNLGVRQHQIRMSITHQGSCLCGGISFTITGPLAPIQVCHCAQCRQAQGGPFATNIPVEVNSIAFQQGAELLQHYESSPGKIRAFCKVCGSPVFSKRISLPDVLRIRAGLLGEPVAAGLAFHAFTGSKASWWSICPGLPEYGDGAPQPTEPKS